MKLVFEKTGDALGFESPNQNLLEYFLTQCNNSNVSVFKCSQSLKDYSLEIFDCIHTIDDFLTSKLKIDVFSKYRKAQLNQITLNHLHEDWVKFQAKYDKICLILERKHPDLLHKFRWINETIHDIENSSYHFKNYDTHVWQCHNPYGTSILDFNKYNIIMKFNNLGRPSFDKWTHYDDDNLDEIDDFSMLSGQIIVDLTRPYTQSPPAGYTNWCKDNGRPVIGRTLGIGNFTDKIDIISEVFYRNMQNEGCTIFFELPA